MAAGAPPASLSRAYERRLAVLDARTLAAVNAAFDLFDRDRSWVDLFADLYIAWTAAQLDGVTTADLMAAATTLSATGTVPAAPMVRSALVGTTSAGTPVMDVLRSTQRIVGVRMLTGQTFADSFMSSATWLTGTISAEAHRTARDGTIDLAANPASPLTRYRRIAEPGACAFCRALATRGAVYRSAETASGAASGKRYHERCRCRVEAVVDKAAQTATVKAGESAWARMLATGDVPRIRGRGSPRQPAPVASVVNLRRAHETQLRQLTASIPDLERRVAAGDPAAVKPLAWQTARADELRRLLAATP